MGTKIIGCEGGHVPWTAAHVTAGQELAAPQLSRAIALAANTGQRGSDLIKMRWTDVERLAVAPAST
jgi:integrase